jgi:hypothetical protein
MNKNEVLHQIPLFPSDPQAGGKEEESNENPIISFISEVLPQGEVNEGSEGLTQEHQSENAVSYTETF